ncbi:VWA domain-containing protein [Oculatella sp. FACHB-28]|nr:VWA domain-containing protein [Oculatella sp. FACHB-28]
MDSEGRPFHVLWLLLIYAGLPVIVYLIYWRSRTSSAKASPDSRAADPPTAPEPTNSPKQGSEAADKDRDVSAAPQLPSTLPIMSRSSFRQTTEYFPLTRRQMKQSWRFLRRMVRTGTPTELDVEATLNQISRQGMLLEPVLVPRRANQSRLLLLIDQDGSMVPFHSFSERLAETAVRGGRLENANVYYFHNCPMDYLYGDRYFQQAETIDEVLNTVQSSYTGVLIFSDAGAARGTLNAERLELTTAFLTTFKRRVRYIAWLNPLPSARWVSTTAGQISQVVPMFELNRRGLDEAISVLRGRFR